MNKKKVILLCAALLLTVAGILDAARYLKRSQKNKQVVQQYGSFSDIKANEIVLVYNAWGGIYPGLVDFVHKELFPKTYPCNLCYQTFGTFSMKQEWKQYLASLPYKITELHKDDFKKMYKPENLTLPVILLSNGSAFKILAGEKELNQTRSLNELILLVKNNLNSAQL